MFRNVFFDNFRNDWKYEIGIQFEGIFFVNGEEFGYFQSIWKLTFLNTSIDNVCSVGATASADNLRILGNKPSRPFALLVSSDFKAFVRRDMLIHKWYFKLSIIRNRRFDKVVKFSKVTTLRRRRCLLQNTSSFCFLYLRESCMYCHL